MSKSAADFFHAHLDVCERCAKNPFDLCPIGASRLSQTMSKTSIVPKGQDLTPGHYYRILQIDPSDPNPTLKVGDVVLCAEGKPSCIDPGNVASDGMGVEWFADYKGTSGYGTLVLSVEDLGSVGWMAAASR